MEWVIYIIMGFGILYFIGSFGGKSSSQKKSSSKSLGSFIDNSKEYSDIQECVNVIGNYLYQNNFKDYEDASESFPDFIEKLIKEYKHGKKIHTQSLTSTEKWYEEEIAKCEDDEEKNLIREERKLQDKQDNKIIAWHDREIEKVRKDMKPIMKKYMSETIKHTHPRAPHELDLPKELPDSYYD